MQQNHYIRIKDKREKQAIGLITTSMLYTTNIYCKSTNRKCREKKNCRAKTTTKVVTKQQQKQQQRAINAKSEFHTIQTHKE